MNQIKFNNELISITYNSNEEAEHAKWIFYDHELDHVEVEGKTLTFHYKELRFLNNIIEDIIRKTFKEIRTEKNLIDRGTYISEHFEAILPSNKLFKITLINSRNTIGEYGFGCWQFGRILSLNNIYGVLKISLRNSNLDDVRHELTFKEDITVLVEIVEIQSQ